MAHYLKCHHIQIMSLVLILFIIMSMASARRIQDSLSGLYFSSKEDCLCQCSPLVYNDMFGIKRGNCRNTFQEGKFCYVVGDSESMCKDLKPSARFMGKYISTQACLTPHLDSFVCKSYKLSILSNTDKGQPLPFQIPIEFGIHK